MRFCFFSNGIPIKCVHGSNDPQIRRQRKEFVRILKFDGSASIFQQIKQLSKDLCHISTIQLVNYQNKPTLWFAFCFFCQLFQRSFHQQKSHPILSCCRIINFEKINSNDQIELNGMEWNCTWTISFNKIFIGISRMKLDYRDFPSFGSSAMTTK